MTLLGKIASTILPRLDPFLGEEFYPMFRRSPVVIYDVGSAGQVFYPFTAPVCDMARVYGFEPVDVSHRKLVERYKDNTNVTVQRAALSDSDGSVTFYVCKDSLTKSSLLEHSRLDVEFETVTAEAVRLDSVSARFEFPPADFVKLDTEGSELTILRSGEELLRRDVLGVFVEISFWRHEQGGAEFHDVDKFLRDRGFILYDLQINRNHFSGVGAKKDKLRSGDALYLRDFDQYVLENGNTLAEDDLRTKLLKLVALAAAWQYLEYVLELLSFGREKALITEEEFFRLARRYAGCRDISTRIPDFPGRVAMARIADFLSYALHKGAGKGVPAAFNQIGNAWPGAAKGKVPDFLTVRHPVLGRQDTNEKTIRLGSGEAQGGTAKA